MLDTYYTTDLINSTSDLCSQSLELHHCFEFVWLWAGFDHLSTIMTQGEELLCSSKKYEFKPPS